MKSPIERSFVVKRYGLSFVIGLLTGIFSGLLGIEGGIILVPLIAFFFTLVHRQVNSWMNTSRRKNRFEESD